ncbi:hypothetical protein [Rubrivirga sp.]|uniref:hypothetical protein n=1 Tax=Rubrivirga sp. TaxID=1885344 RepID=UPI003B52BD65
MPFAALDATAEALARRVLADVPADRTRGAADVDRLPTPLVPILHARLAAAVEAAAPMPSAWLDAEPVREAAQAWRQAAEAAVAFPADEWAKAVHEAATRALAHLVRPAETLAAVAFLGRPATLPVEDALDQVRMFGPYPYLPQIAARYAERKGLATIDRAGLEELFLRIDRRMVSTFGPGEWATLLSPLLALVGPVGSPAGTVPTALLRPLFMTKGAGAVAVELEGTDAVSSADLRAILDRTLVPSGDSPTGSAPPAAPETDAPDRDPEPEAAPDPPAPFPPLPVAESARPPEIGSKYLAPEYDDDDDSAVLGPPRPVGSPSPDDALPADDAADGERAEGAPTDDVPDDFEADRPSDGDPTLDDAPLDLADAPGDAGGAADPMDEIRDTVATPAEPEREEAPTVPTLGLPQTPLLASTTPAPEADEPTEASANPTFDSEDPPSVSAPADAPATEDDLPEDDEPIWRRLARAEDEASASAPAAATDDEEPLWKRFAQSDLAARLPVSPPAPDDEARPQSPDLDVLETRVLGPDARERRDWFVEELFDGSASAYQETLGRIDHAATYTEATGIVSSDVFRAHRVNPYTEAAVAFIDTIQSQFGAR